MNEVGNDCMVRSRVDLVLGKSFQAAHTISLAKFRKR